MPDAALAFEHLPCLSRSRQLPQGDTCSLMVHDIEEKSREKRTMDIKIKRMDDICVVSLIGSMDALTSEKISDSLNELIDTGEKNIVLDITEVDFMSSAGLRTILVALKATRRIGGDLCLAGAQTRPARFLKLSGFVSLLRAYTSVDEAVERFKT